MREQNINKKRRGDIRSGVSYLYPATLVSVTQRLIQVIAPNGMAEGHVSTARQFRSLLKAAGAIKQCSIDTLRDMRRLYSDNEKNRTVAFLDAVIKKPSNVVLAMERLSKMRVFVVGCGGIGTGTAFLLAGMGVKNFVLIDGDQVEASNLNRQFLFSLKDVGLAKASVLRRELKKRFSRISIEVRAVNIAANQAAIAGIKRSDVAVISADDPPNLFQYIGNELPNGVELWSGGYLYGISHVERRFLKKNENPVAPAVWLRGAKISPSVGFQNFDICARLALGIAVGSTRRAYSLDYRGELQTRNAD